MSTVLLGILAVPNKQAFWSLFVVVVVVVIIIIIRFGIKIRAPDGIETLVAFLICLNVSAWCSYESHVLVQNWLCDCVMQSIWLALLGDYYYCLKSFKLCSVSPIVLENIASKHSKLWIGVFTFPANTPSKLTITLSVMLLSQALWLSHTLSYMESLFFS